MSNPRGQFNNPSSGDHETHLHQHAQASDTTWKDDEYDSSLSGSHPAHQAPHARHPSGDRVLYTEKVTKEYDAQGNVIRTNVEHPKPGTMDALDDSESGVRGASSGTASRRQPMVSDDYGRTGSTRVGNEAQRNVTSEDWARRNAANVKPSVADKITGAGQKGMGEATSNPNLYYRGEDTQAGGRYHYDPVP
ncbi:hypothetical protein DFP72DRAFT_596260 [Ephemerocybe angulata]|uniref:Uncharacterized protein n=1 Tax=Ephemerocybe angulata TaxID=980116 RepID=A0A8H6ID92_9AGAR|nr:hypothetical protein DFP72DRAFT_596260 [Tulosesus angulatus]